MRAYAPLAIFIGVTMVLSACKREQRDFEPDKVDVAKLGPVPLVNLEPGGHTPPKNLEAGKDYEQNAYHLEPGKGAVQRNELQWLPFERRGWHGPGFDGRRLDLWQ